MGRSNIMPLVKEESLKMSLRRLPFVDGCYDQGGAYWGSPANVYRAVTTNPEGHLWRSNWDGSAQTVKRPIEVFVRARNRNEAKLNVRVLLPNAKFYR